MKGKSCVFAQQGNVYGNVGESNRFGIKMGGGGHHPHPRRQWRDYVFG